MREQGMASGMKYHQIEIHWLSIGQGQIQNYILRNQIQCINIAW